MTLEGCRPGFGPSTGDGPVREFLHAATMAVRLSARTKRADRLVMARSDGAYDFVKDRLSSLNFSVDIEAVRSTGTYPGLLNRTRKAKLGVAALSPMFSIW